MIVRLRAGDEAAFARLVDSLQARLIAFAGSFTSSPALAEDIVQETWLAVIRGLPAFEGRSSLRTWIFSILVRRARTLAARESRRNPASTNGVEHEPEWDIGCGNQGLWERRVAPWGLEDPASVFQTQEALGVIREAVAALPEAQRQAVLLRDVEDLPAADVCNILGITETNQRVLLHRGRSRIRRALDRYVRGDEGGSVRERAAAGGAPGARSVFSTEDA